MSFLGVLAFAANSLLASLPSSVLNSLFLNFAVSARPLNMEKCRLATRLFVGRPNSSSSERVCAMHLCYQTFFKLSSTCLLHVIFGRPCFRCQFTFSIIALFSIKTFVSEFCCFSKATEYGEVSFSS